MDRPTYDRFTSQLAAWATADARVVGLVALGSMADAGRAPDEWSDHDFWVVARDTHAPALRADASWLPDAERIVAHFAVSLHGRSAIYDDGHLVELAVFEPNELQIARANVYRVLYDECGLEEAMAELAAKTAAHPETGGSLWAFLAQLLIGVNRYGRGEHLSAHAMIRSEALTTLLQLVAATAPPDTAHALDDLDPHRRFELAFPTLAAQITAAVERPLLNAAEDLLAIARTELAGETHRSAFDAVEQRVRSVSSRS